METTSTEVTSIQHRNDIEKSKWRTHRYFDNFESRIHVEISTSIRCHNFHVDSSSKIDEISTNFSREFRRRIDGESAKMCPLGRHLEKVKIIGLKDHCNNFDEKYDGSDKEKTNVQRWINNIDNACRHNVIPNNDISLYRDSTLLWGSITNTTQPWRGLRYKWEIYQWW